MAHVLGDQMDSAQLANNVAYIYETGWEAGQFNRSNDTLRHFKPRKFPIEGKGLYFYAYTQPFSGVRRTKSSEAEFPEAYDIDHTQVNVDWDDLTEFQVSLSYTGLAERMTRKEKLSVFKVAQRLVEEANAQFAAQVNVSLHQGVNSVMALVSDTPTNEDGTTYTQGHDEAFIPIDTGSISQFWPGMIIAGGTTPGTVEYVLEVNDVYYGNDGPGSDTGPGIVATNDSTRSTAESVDADCNDILNNDSIWLYGEAAASNLDGFPVWFDETADLLDITRADVGSRWSIPHVITASANFDYDDHFRPIVVKMGRSVRAGRARRKRDGLAITPAMLLLTTPELNDEITSNLQDTKRAMVSFATSMDQAEVRRLFGDIGFDGVILHHPSLPAPMGIQTDTVATPDTIRLLETSSWSFVTGHNSNTMRPEWLNKDGRMWHYIQGANGRMQNELMAAGLIRLELISDQPGANGEIASVTSSLTI